MHALVFEKFPIVNLMSHQSQKSLQNRIVMTGETFMFIYETRLICQD